jgi:hypothetical protein
MRPNTIMSVSRIDQAGRSLCRLLYQPGNRGGNLCTIPRPVFEALGVDYERLLRAGSDRIVVADTLDEATVATIALVGGDNVEKGALLGATTGKANDDHVVFLVKFCSGMRKARNSNRIQGFEQGV